MMAFLAERTTFDLMSFIFPLVVVFMSMSIPIVAIITEHLQKKERMRLIEKAIEHGANLDNLDLEDPAPRPRLPYRSGMVALAVGVAMFMADRYTEFSFGNFHFPLVVGGLIVGAVGIALLINDWINRDSIRESLREHRQ